jgi:hypothetical protein
MKAPFVAFNLDTSGNPTIAVTTVAVDKYGIPRRPFEHDFGSLESLTTHGLEWTATLIGKTVLAILNRNHVDVFKAFPELVVPLPELKPGDLPPYP